MHRVPAVFLRCTKNADIFHGFPPFLSIGTEDVKRLLKAPGDYVGVGRMFASALAETGFKGEVTPFNLAKIRPPDLGELK